MENPTYEEMRAVISFTLDRVQYGAEEDGDTKVLSTDKFMEITVKLSPAGGEDDDPLRYALTDRLKEYWISQGMEHILKPIREKNVQDNQTD